jgi:CDP-paratose 2-epimerase
VKVPHRHVLITGGAGFVGTNLASRLLDDGHRVLVYDNLSRPGVGENLDWLKRRYGDSVSARVADVRDAAELRSAVRGATAVFHLAAQVAVTTSLGDPVDDFEVNLLGTLNLLEELRRLRRPVPFLFTSTNKVYGALADLELVRAGERWEPVDDRFRTLGVGERRPLDFCTPYGCSKGGADQYVLDYAKTYGLPAVVFRMSCIYGPHQHGNEDQGWVAHFLLSAVSGEQVTIYGDGAQVRDILHASDLAEAMVVAHANVDRLAGTAFNVGGGPANTISLLELLHLMGELEGNPLDVVHADERPGDQRWYVSDTTRLREATGWHPRVGVRAGIEALHRWLAARRPSALVAARAR